MFGMRCGQICRGQRLGHVHAVPFDARHAREGRAICVRREADAKPNAKPNATANAKPNATANAKPNAKPNVTANAKPDARADAIAHFRANGGPDGNPNACTNAEPDACTNAEPDACTNAVSNAEPVPRWHSPLRQVRGWGLRARNAGATPRHWLPLRVCRRLLGELKV